MRAHRKIVMIQNASILRVMRDGAWRDTRGIANDLPWSVSTVWHRLRDLAARGIVEKRTPRSYIKPCEVHWRSPDRKYPENIESAE